LLHFHIDNLYTRVDKKLATKEELEQIHKILSVRVPGYFYSPHFRRGLWDGYRRFFNLLTSTFYTGLIGYVTSKIEFPYEIIDDRVLVEHKNNILSLNGIELRDYQIKMINEAVSTKRGIISAPPNAGKTEVACGIIQVLGLPTNFFTHRITLMKQTKARMEQRLGVKIGMIGAGIKEIEDINVLSVPSIAKNLNDSEIKEMLSRSKVVISDECLPYNSQVLVDIDKTVEIGNIVENSINNLFKVEYVISYNLELKKYEKKKIVRYIKILGSNPWYKIFFNKNNKEVSFKCTGNHKIYVKNRGYIKTKDLCVGDEIIFNESNSKKIFLCKFCGKEFLTGSSLGGHHSQHNFNKNYFLLGKWLKEHGYPIQDPKIKKRIFCKRSKNAKYRKYLSDRMKISNPSFDRLTVEKSRNSNRLFYENNPDKLLERKKNFISAHRKRKFPTRPEAIIKNLKIEKLKYTGDGVYWIEFKIGSYSFRPKQRHKCPDFIVEGQKKVIEIGNTSYWYSKEKIESLIEAYRTNGYQCLFIGDDELSDIENIKEKIFAFMFNHTYKVTKIKERANNRIPKYIYNLEVEDNHNFFADNILVSNCHHISSKTFESCLKACNTSYYRYGLSATALRKDEISNLIVRGLTGDEIVSVTNRELIDAGISASPTAYLHYVSEPKIPGHYTFDQAYEKGILNNLERNRFIVMSAKRFVEQGKSVFILVWRIAHGEVILKMVEDIGLEVEFISGGRDNVQDALDKFKKKKLRCLISSTISDEGLDVPAMDVLIMGVGFKAPLKTIQRVGRALRKKSGENVVTIVDFVDAHNKKYLYKHSEDRVKEYLNMGMEIFEVDETWERIITV